MPNYYRKLEADDSNLKPGRLAYVDDIHTVQDRIGDGFASSIRDFHGDSHIIGSDENTFILSPSDITNGEYIDQYNENYSDDENLKWMSFYETYLRQKITIDKTEIKNISVKLRNLTNIDIDVVFDITDVSEDMIQLGTQTIKLSKNTEEQEFKIPFDLSYLPIGDYYFVIKSVNLSVSDLSPEFGEDELIDWDSNPIAVLYDYDGNYNQSLKVSFTGLNYSAPSVVSSQIEYFPDADLWFKTEYGGGYTYDVEPGIAQIDGEKVPALQTHVSISKGLDEGNRTDLVLLTKDGFYDVISSDVWTAEEIKPQIEMSILKIGYITIYQNDNKPPLIDQDDTKMVTRKRSLLERTRRLEKQMEYSLDRNAPGKLKYNISGAELQDTSKEANMILTTNSKGEAVFTTEVENQITKKYYWSFKEFVAPAKITITSKMSSIQKKAAKYRNALIDANVKLGLYKNPIDGMYEKSGGCTFSNISTDYEEGRLSLKIQKETPNIQNGKIELKDGRVRIAHKREYIIRRHTPSWKTGVHSDYPAFVFTPKKDITLNHFLLNSGNLEFKNMKNVKISIMTRDPDAYCVKLGNKCEFSNPYNSNAYSLSSLTTNSRGVKVITKDIKFTVNKKLTKGQQYIVFVYGDLIKGKDAGAIYVNQREMKNKDDDLNPNDAFRHTNIIRYYGPYYNGSLPSTFYLEKMYDEVGYGINSIITDVTYSKTGTIISPTLSVPGDNAKIKSISFSGAIKTPSGCNYTVHVSNDAGMSWVLVKDKKASFIKAGNQFKWKITLNGDGDSTPILYYSKNAKYAVRFSLNVSTSDISANPISQERETCLTTVPFNGDKIIKEVLGDNFLNYNIDGNINRYNSKFNSFEFARVYAEELDGKIIIDLNAADYYMEVDNINVNHWSTIITDLTFDDFTQESVDLSYYESDLEYDEHNYRFNLETDKMYNDSDIIIEPSSYSISEWSDINTSPITSGIMNYESIDSKYFGQQTQLVVKEEFNDLSKVIMGKKFKDNGLNLSDYKYLNLSITIPKTVKTLVGGGTETLTDFQANSFSLIFSKNEYGDTENYSGYEVPISSIIKRGEGGNIIQVDISSISYDLNSIKSIGLKSKIPLRIADDGDDDEIIRINYISGAINNITRLVSQNSQWSSLNSNVLSVNQDAFSNNVKFDFKINSTSVLSAGKLAKIELNSNIDSYNFIRYNMEWVNTKYLSGAWTGVGADKISNIVKGIFYFDLCADSAGDIVIESIPMPTLLSSGRIDDGVYTPLSTTIFKKIKDVGEIKSIVLRTTGTDKSIENLYIKLNDFSCLTADKIPIIHNTLRMKIYPEFEDSSVEKPEIRKAGVIIKL